MKRRSFINTLGLGLGAFSLPSIFSPSAQAKQDGEPDTTSQDDIRFAEAPNPDAGLDKPLTAIIIGAGARGGIYAHYAARFPGSMKIVGVSDINEFRRNRMADAHQVPKEARFGDWSEVLAKPKCADIVFICTPDNLHYEPCLKALDLGYDILLEKPAAQTEEECIAIRDKAVEKGRIVVLSHVLRFAPYFAEMHKLLREGRIGKIISVQHFEPVGAEHMAHSFVRGNWRNSVESTPMIVSKSCHDMDILRWLIDKPCLEVSAFGGVGYFNRENEPEGCADRCLDCAKETEATCPFSAKRIYYDRRSWCGYFDLSGTPEEQGEQILRYLKESNYGKCVFRSDNDQCDHFVMNMLFEDGITVSFDLEGLTSYEGRFTRIMGSKGDIVGDMRDFTLTEFLTGKKHHWSSKSFDGHGGGDAYLTRDFLIAVASKDPKAASSTIQASIASHVMGFRGEQSRLKGVALKIPEGLG